MLHTICRLIIENVRMCVPVEMADPRMFTKRSSAALWMWKTSSLNRQRQELLWRANFHKLRAAGSLFRAAWHKMNPTRTQNREAVTNHIQCCYICKTRPIQDLCSRILTIRKSVVYRKYERFWLIWSCFSTENVLFSDLTPFTKFEYIMQIPQNKHRKYVKKADSIWTCWILNHIM